MDSSLISRLVKLIGKNGDRIILPDPETGRTVVIMDLEAYEGLLAADGGGSVGASVVGKGTPETPPTDLAEDAAPMFRAPSKIVAEETSEFAPRRAPAADLESVMEPVAEHIVESIAGDEIILPSSTPKKQRNSAKKRHGTQDGPAAALMGVRDLTQDELLDKINRDIGEWKTAQEVKRTEELQSAAGQRPVLTVTETLEDEERFYLEPIE